MIEKGDIVRFITTHKLYGTKFVVRAVDGGQAWVTSLREGNVVREQVVWIDGLVKVDE